MKTKFISIAATLLLAASANTAFATYYLIGDFNEWDQTSMLEFIGNGSGGYTLTPLDAISGKFKIKDDKGNWYGGATDKDYYSLNFINNSVTLVDAKNLSLEAELNYTFTIDNNKVLTVSGFNNFYIAGSFNEWKWGESIEMAYNSNDGSFSAEIEIPANTTFKFKDSKTNGNYYGAHSNGKFYILNTMCSNLTLESPGEDFYIQRAGTYKITITSDKKLNVDGFFTEIYDETSFPQSSDPIDVELPNLTLYKDGYWNTLCLPFGVNSFTGTPLEGAEVRELSEASLEEGTLTLNFGDPVSSISSGIPYIVKWTSGSNITSPRFFGVTIEPNLEPAIKGNVSFIGTFASETISGQNYLYLGADNTLYWPSSSVTINPFRAYFELDLPVGQQAKSFVLNFDDDNEETSIKQINNSESATSTWFTLDGRRLNDMPATAGLYIINGKKVVIK